MTLNERILDFMDGTLPAEEEAELLHILSVSPERRNLLRSFMNQTALFARDRQSIQVPYQAEQKLWERLGPLMPVLPMMETAAATAPAMAPVVLESAEIEAAAVQTVRNRAIPVPVSFFSRLLSSTSAAIASVTMILGLGVGYIAGTNQTPDVKTVYIQSKAAPAIASQTATPFTAAPSTSTPSTSAPSFGRSRSANTFAFAANSLRSRTTQDHNAIAASNSSLVGSGNANADLAATAIPTTTLPLFAQNKTPDVHVNVVGDPIFTQADEDRSSEGMDRAFNGVTPRESSSIAMSDIGGEDGAPPIYLHTSELPTPAKSFLERFEFSFTESFGRQYPNSTATNTTLPIITNSAVGAFFQVLPRSNALWFGASYGTANITRKNLTTHQDPLDPMNTVLSSDTVHAPTSYLAAYLQYRLPLFHSMDLTMTGGYGLASIGKMFMGELGVHYDVSREVGFQMGLRALEFNYSLAKEFDDALSSSKSSLVISKGVSAASPSYNVEINTGLYFHF